MLVAELTALSAPVGPAVLFLPAPAAFPVPVWVVLADAGRFAGLIIFRCCQFTEQGCSGCAARQAAFLIPPGVEGDPVMIFPELMFSSPIVGSKTSY